MHLLNFNKSFNIINKGYIAKKAVLWCELFADTSDSAWAAPNNISRISANYRMFQKYRNNYPNVYKTVSKNLKA